MKKTVGLLIILVLTLPGTGCDDTDQGQVVPDFDPGLFKTQKTSDASNQPDTQAERQPEETGRPIFTKDTTPQIRLTFPGTKQEEPEPVKSWSFDSGLNTLRAYYSAQNHKRLLPKWSRAVAIEKSSSEQGGHCVRLSADASGEEAGVQTGMIRLKPGRHTVSFFVKAISSRSRVTVRVTPEKKIAQPTPEIVYVSPEKWQRRAFSFEADTFGKWQLELGAQGPRGAVQIDALKLTDGDTVTKFGPSENSFFTAWTNSELGLIRAGEKIALNVSILNPAAKADSFSGSAKLSQAFFPSGRIPGPPFPPESQTGIWDQNARSVRLAFTEPEKNRLNGKAEFKSIGPGFYRLELEWEKLPGKKTSGPDSLPQTVYTAREIPVPKKSFFGSLSSLPPEWRDTAARLGFTPGQKKNHSQEVIFHLDKITETPETVELIGEEAPTMFAREIFRSKNKGRKIIAEGGDFTAFASRSFRLAAYMARQALLFRGAGFSRWRLDLGKGNNPVFPLFDQNFNPTPTLAALDFQQRLLSSAECVFDIRKGPGIRLQAYLRSDGRPVIVFWNWHPEDEFRRIDFQIPSLPGDFTVMNTLGSSIAAKAGKDGFIVSLSSWPSYILGSRKDASGFIMAMEKCRVPLVKETVSSPRFWSITAEGEYIQPLPSTLHYTPEGFTLLPLTPLAPRPGTDIGLRFPGYAPGVYKYSVKVKGDPWTIRLKHTEKIQVERKRTENGEGLLEFSIPAESELLVRFTGREAAAIAAVEVKVP